MKTIRHLTLVCAGLCAAFLHLAAPAIRAADANPPGKLTYQGFLTDSTGVPYGNSSPVNQAIIFRIWKTATGGSAATDLVWAEWQTVTIDKGHFSVLLGEGAPEAANSTKSSATPATTVFTGADASDRYMEIHLATAAGVASGAAITPRLQFQPAPYAALSRNARQIVDDAGNAVLTAASGAATFTGNVTASGFTGSGAGLTALNASQLSAGTVPDARLSGTYGNALTLNNAANVFSGNGANLTALNASQVTSGTLPVAQVPNLDASKITTGSLPDSRLATITTAGKVSDSALSANIPLKNVANAFTTGTQTIQAGAAATKPLVVQGAASQTANLQEWQNSAGSAVASVSPSGYLSLSGGHLIFNAADGVINWGPGGALHFRTLTTQGAIAPYSEKMTIMHNGNVGIGTDAPSVKLHVSGSSSTTGRSSSPLSYYFDSAASGYSFNSASGKAFNTSIKASDFVEAAGFHVYSDVRIKRVEGRSDRRTDLATILEIEVTDYTYLDTLNKGTRRQKKVIAQQVEKVFPQAVGQSTDVVPDIYQKASIKEGWVTLATSLKQGERVRLVGEHEEGVYEVLEVRADGFRTAFNPLSAKVFVYGREVKDFRTVDYEAIAMLNVSATQELARQVEALRKSEARIAELEQKVSQMDALERKLADLEKLVARAGESRKESRPAAEAPASEVKAGANR